MLEIRGLVRNVAGGGGQPGFALEAEFSVPDGARACLIGRSGSGKTTLLRAIAGLDPAAPGDRGSIRVGGRELQELPPEKRGVGFVFQEQLLFPQMSVLENCVFGLKLRGVSAPDRAKKGREWLGRLRMESFADTGVDKLSGGERQRVAFIRALIWEPALLLLDEPFSALDTELREVLRRDLLELHRLRPVPMLIVTHDPGDVSSLATRQLSIVESGSSVRRVVETAVTS